MKQGSPQPASRLSFALSLRFLWRDWKSGELNILIASLVLAIATVTSISLFTSRIHNSIFDEASDFLAADARVSGTLPIPQEWHQKAEELNLQQADVTRFRAMTFAGDNMTLAQVKAVSDAYPLKGELQISDSPFSKSVITTTEGPPAGEAWLASRLFNALNIENGDSIAIGEAEFIVTAAIAKEPDSGQSLFGVAPRVMIHLSDVGKTGAIQVGSRADYDFLLAGDSKNIERMRAWLESDLGEHYRWTGVKAGNRGVGSAMTRAESFLLLTGCLSVVLSGVAIALAARRYAKRQQGQVALLKTLGTQPDNILRFYATGLLMIGLVTILIGALAGWTLHWGILVALGSLMPQQLAPASWDAYSTGAVTGFIALWAFAAPPIYALRHVTPASILREERDQVISAGISSLIGITAIIALMWFYSRDLMLTAIVTVGAGVCLAGVALISRLLISLAKKLGAHLSYTWRLGLASLSRHQRFNTLQIMIFSVLLMLLFILLMVRTTLISQWQSQLPEDAPNHFIFNIFADEAEDIKSFFSENNIQYQPFYPMVRGRIVDINGVSRKTLASQADNDMNYEREVNLTWSETFGSDNKIIAGKSWQDSSSEELLVSVEQEYAEGLNIEVGDQLRFSSAGQEFSANVTSIRSVQWDSMNPNFFLIFNRAFSGSSGANWISSFFLPTDKKNVLNELTRTYPTVSLIELDQTLDQIKSIITKVSSAIEFILLLVLGSGILVLITSIQATLDVRLVESAVFRALGANRQLVRKTLLIEFTTLGLLAGLLAVAGTELSLFFLQTEVFDLDYQSQGLLWLWGPLLAAALIGFIGWMSARRVVSVPPLAVLREQ